MDENETAGKPQERKAKRPKPAAKAKKKTPDDRTNSPHDKRLKQLFRNKKAFVSFLKECVKSEWAKDIDEDSLKPSPKSYILSDFEEKEVDVLYESKLKSSGEKVYLYVLLENQSWVDYRMAYRLLLYIVEIMRDHYNNADEKERKRKSFRFPAVIPIVFYTGRGKWTAARNLREIFYDYERFGGSVVNFEYAMVDAKSYDAESVKEITSPLLRLAMLLEKSQDFTDVIKTIDDCQDDIAELGEDEQRVLNVVFKIFKQVYGNTEEFELTKIFGAKSAEEVSGMLVDFQANVKKRDRILIRQGREQGIEQGREETEAKALAEKIEIAKKLSKKGLTIEDISESTGLDITVIQNAVEAI